MNDTAEMVETIKDYAKRAAEIRSQGGEPAELVMNEAGNKD